MTNQVWKRNEIESPCIKVCVIHPVEKICIGCFRTVKEISNWSNYSSRTRTAISQNLQNRAIRLTPKRRGGRNGRLKDQI